MRRQKILYKHQREIVSKNKNRVLVELAKRNLSFNELAAAVYPFMVRTTLNSTLKRLMRERSIQLSVTFDDHGRRRLEYEILNRGIEVQKDAREDVARAVEVIRALAGTDESSKALLELSNFSKENPEVFEAFIRSFGDIMAVVKDQNVQKFVGKRGVSQLREKTTQKVTEELAKQGISEKDLKDFDKSMIFFRAIPKAIQEVVSNK